MSGPRGRRAWLVTWVSATSAQPENPIAAIFGSRIGSDKVKAYMEFLYAAEHFSGEEMLGLLSDPDANPYPASYNKLAHHMGDQTDYVPYQGQIVCGHNPYLYGRLVNRLRVGEGTYPDGSRQLVWEEILRPSLDRWT
ncbi:hypothetical protein GU243_02975 [Pseudarthrobacter psychrotolerans]|uniref:Uncharacterized protein n=1 Tax=Pseudarthrobacter psychrotolerans TaxID=2697569 RepID=A0A6P1NKB6_9MICC|nr:hypothetical protein [Pseudarthrobacter psychrotolerans]QHK18900.1 hypothetical protein GU243_02975 [Pseudarthrobacter psychrotolerans]